ncbi:hypothetical protein ACFYSH_28310 [Streptomyces sp. NPDC005791]|uniref:hypothetical protein n=1 Tax=Streptomyces sp. NPDC005791 TaxID=3364732 RepID=UPI0036C71DD2
MATLKRLMINLGLTHTNGTWHLASARARPQGRPGGLAAGPPRPKMLKTLGADNIAKTTRAIRDGPRRALPILGITTDPETYGT